MERSFEIQLPVSECQFTCSCTWRNKISVVTSAHSLSIYPVFTTRCFYTGLAHSIVFYIFFPRAFSQRCLSHDRHYRQQAPSCHYSHQIHSAHIENPKPNQFPLCLSSVHFELVLLHPNALFQPFDQTIDGRVVVSSIHNLVHSKLMLCTSISLRVLLHSGCSVITICSKLVTTTSYICSPVISRSTNYHVVGQYLGGLSTTFHPSYTWYFRVYGYYIERKISKKCMVDKNQ